MPGIELVQPGESIADALPITPLDMHFTFVSPVSIAVVKGEWHYHSLLDNDSSVSILI